MPGTPSHAQIAPGTSHGSTSGSAGSPSSVSMAGASVGYGPGSMRVPTVSPSPQAASSTKPSDMRPPDRECALDRRWIGTDTDHGHVGPRDHGRRAAAHVRRVPVQGPPREGDL